MNRKTVFILAGIMLLMLSCSMFSSSSPAPAALSTSGPSGELIATMTALAQDEPVAPAATEAVLRVEPTAVVGLVPAPVSTQPGLASTQPGLASTQPGLASTQPGLASTQPGLASTQPGIAGSAPPLDTTFTLQDEPIIDDRVGEAKMALQTLGYEICSSDFFSITPFYTAQAAYAVSQFQAANGLPATGDLDPATWAALFSADPQPAPQGELVEYEVKESFFANYAGDMTVINGTVWAFPEGFGFIEAYNPSTSEIYQGIYAVNTLPGEEYYTLSAATTDGTLLWAALQADDVILQAYDVANASPVEGMLYPLLDQSIHVPAYYIYGLAYDGARLWVSADGDMSAILAAADPAKGTTEIYVLKYEYFPMGGAYDSINRTLWVPMMGVLGDSSIMAVDPLTGPTYEILGACGLQVAFDGKLLWVLKADRIVGMDPVSGEARAVAYLGGPMSISSFAYSNGSLWLLSYETGAMLRVEIP